MVFAALGVAVRAQAPSPLPAGKAISASACTAEQLGTEVAPELIGEPVSSVSFGARQWRAEAGPTPAHCRVEGTIAPVDPNAPPIRFAVALPASWAYRAAQMGGSGMNGVIPRLTGGAGRSGPSLLQRGFAVYGSDSGHQGGGFSRPDPAANAWALNAEAIANLGYMQMKKTHDAAMVVIHRIYGDRPRFNYYFGGSQGGREGLTVAQRYPVDYDGVWAEVPIVNFSSLMLAPGLIRIQEKPLANWVTPAKVNAIRGEFIRQCDKLDGLADGVINNYMACRAIFDTKRGPAGRDPWAARRCPDNADPNPQDASAAACLTDGQIATLRMVYSPYLFTT
jgi:feruloyl esterase